MIKFRLLIFALLPVVAASIVGVLRRPDPLVIQADTPFQVSFIHDGLLMPQYRWWCDGALIKTFTAEDVPLPVPFTTDATGYVTTDEQYTFRVTVPGLAAGTHTCAVSAVNDLGEAMANPLTISALDPQASRPPATPSHIRVVAPAHGGGQ